MGDSIISVSASIRLIQTHPGGAHKDDFLACCLLVHLHKAPVLRAEPGEGDLDDPSVCVVDVGGRHQPEGGNFDHHQLPRDHPPTCALSLVLQHLGLYEDARLFCDWLETAEWFDARGPNETARWLGVDRAVLAQLNSPIDITLLRRFAQSTRLEQGDPLWQMMQWIGEDLIHYLRDIRSRLDYIDRHARFWALERAGEPLQALFLPRVEPLPADPSAGLTRYLLRHPPETPTVALVYPDRRGSGYGLARFNDDARLDFTRVQGEPDVHFAHAGGFVAKTTATDPGRLRQLIGLALVDR